MTSAEIDAAIRQGAADLCTATEIAARIGVTRHLVWGRAKRMDLALPLARPGQRRRLPVAQPIGLIADSTVGDHERRRADCERLGGDGGCEDVFIRASLAANGTTGGQARCPLRCAGYVAR